MLLENQHPHNKHLMASVIGRPNAGKSTLINQLLGFDLSIVSTRPQTTRNQFHCVLNIDRTEIVFVDTPGLHNPQGGEINRRMNHQAQMAAEGVDVNLVLLDVTFNPIEDLKHILKYLEGQLSKAWIIFTKVDLLNNENQPDGMKNYPFEKVFQEIKNLLPTAEKYFAISSKEETNLHLLTGALCDEAKFGPHFYTDGAISNKNMRFFATEYIREEAFRLLKEELPYELAVVIDEYKDVYNQEFDEDQAHISASILVNRPSQRAIVVGKSGTVIKQIGTNARKKIEAMIGGTAHLNLHVKVSPKWFSNNWVLDEIGLPRSQTQARVWRQK